jgi:molecular chaperone GrpE (heat shock protein)
MSTHHTGLSIVDSLTDSLSSPLAPRVLGIANEIQLAAFRSPGTWTQHVEVQSAAQTAEDDESMARILSVVDRLRIAVSLMEQPNVPATVLVTDITAALAELESLLSSRRVVEIAATVGPLDPVQHEAVAAEPSPDVPRGHIQRVLRRVAVRDGRLIRRALVITSSGPAAS